MEPFKLIFCTFKPDTMKTMKQLCQVAWNLCWAFACACSFKSLRNTHQELYHALVEFFLGIGVCFSAVSEWMFGVQPSALHSTPCGTHSNQTPNTKTRHDSMVIVQRPCWQCGHAGNNPMALVTSIGRFQSTPQQHISSASHSRWSIRCFAPVNACSKLHWQLFYWALFCIVGPNLNM